MSSDYSVEVLSNEDRARLERVYEDLQALSGSSAPSVRAAARAAVAHVAQALNGQAIRYELYTNKWTE